MAGQNQVHGDPEKASQSPLTDGPYHYEAKAPDDSKEEVQPQASPRNYSGFHWVLVVISTLSSIFIYGLDNTITADVIPVVVGRLGDSDKLPWLSVGFTIGSVATVLPFSKLYGLFNAKSLYISSVALFLVGSILCGAAPDLNAFIVGRVIAGVGGQGMYLGVMTLLSVNTSEKERPVYLGLVGLCFGVGMVLGPVIGGAFTQSGATWRWSFYLNPCIGALFSPVYMFILPGFDPRGSQEFFSRFREFDYVGAIFSVATFVCIIMAINFGGTLYPWKSGQIISLFILSGLFITAFSIQQAFVISTRPAHRMFPVAFLKQKEPCLLFILMAVCNAGGFIPVFYVPTYFQFTRGDSPVSAAVRLLPLIILINGVVLINGALMAKFGYYQPWYVAGSALGLVGAVLFSTVTVDTSAAKIYGYEILIGTGVGSYAIAGYAIIQSIVEPSMMAYGIGFIMLAQQIGITTGLSTAGAVFLNVALRDLQDLIPNITGAELQSAILGVSGNFLSSLPKSTQTAALNIIIDALQKIYILSYIAFAVSLIASVFLSRRKLFVT